MKKFFSILLFILVVVIFVIDIYGAIAGAIDVKNKYAEIAARGGSGVDYWGVGADILVIGIAFISIVGFIISLISWKISQYRVIRIVSAVMCVLFLLPSFVCAIILTS